MYDDKLPSANGINKLTLKIFCFRDKKFIPNNLFQTMSGSLSIMPKINIKLDAYRKPSVDGVQYKKSKTFYGKQGKKQAEEYAEALKHKFSKRFPPVIQKVYIGWRLGYVYRVCIPKLTKGEDL